MERCTVLRGECHDAGCYVDTPHACHDILCTTKRLREQLADAQATIAALQARVKELEEITKVICGHCCEPMEIPSKAVLQSQLTQRTAERDTARRRVDELEAREVDVVMLREDLEQRTAELARVRTVSNEETERKTMTHPELVKTLAKTGEAIKESITPEEAHLLHMAIGVSGEAGEILDNIKKHVIYKKPFDRTNMVEELGDIEFYLEGIRQGAGITREECITHNIAKLSTRYHKGSYSDTQAHERADKHDGQDH